MNNQNPQESNQENSTFYDGADAGFEKALQKHKGEEGQVDKLEQENDVELSPADAEVRENEDASLPDDSYAFDEANTGDEEYHDVDDYSGELDFDNDEDFIQ